MSDYEIRNDWSSGGIDWRDTSKDDAMAQDWLKASHSVGAHGSQPVLGRVFELVESNLDPPRGWRIAKRLLDYADDDTEFFQIGHRILPMLLRWHKDLVDDELAMLMRLHPRFRRALQGQISPELLELLRGMA